MALCNDTMTDPARHSKRPFQPSISSFFGRRDVECSQVSWSRPALPPAAPPLPASVQSSLLQVGMRVRKAVPEGYKNEPVNRLGTRSTFPYARDAFTSSNRAIGGLSSHAPAAELTPYCGLHKVGGHSVPASSERPAPFFSPSLFNDGAFGSSQESTDSTVSADSMPAQWTIPCGSSHKRRFEDEDLPHEPLIFEDMDEEADGAVRDTIEGLPPVSIGQLRPLAMPRTRVRGAGRREPKSAGLRGSGEQLRACGGSGRF